MIYKFRSQLTKFAKEVKMEYPAVNIEYEDWNQYPHWSLFASVQLCREFDSENDVMANAKLIASLSEEEVSEISFKQLTKKGFVGKVSR